MPDSAAILGELLAAERSLLVNHLARSGYFISRLSASDVKSVTAMATESAEDQARLAQLIVKRGGFPRPGRPNSSMAGLHYNELHHVLGTLERDYAAVISLYQRGLNGLRDDPEAAQLVSAILGRHRQHVTTLQNLTEQEPTAA